MTRMEFSSKLTLSPRSIDRRQKPVWQKNKASRLPAKPKLKKEKQAVKPLRDNPKKH